MHASKSRLGNDIAKSYLASFARNIQVAFLRQGTVGIGEPCGVEYLVGVQFPKDLDCLLPLCNEDTSPVTPML
ncbi:hypothetical protein HanIR_Chr08g0343361 [Helianthus annuus]|nr:hypothetical protein HanIR_Chr08g0343361 [Helianthus annuus]